MAKNDLAIIGGGLAGGLIALALRKRRPEVGLQIIEHGPALGGNHTWSFHDTDLDEQQSSLVSPLATYRWKEQNVIFPEFSRRLTTGYNSITSSRFHDVVMDRLGDCVTLNCTAKTVTPGSVIFADGREERFGAVIDCRGAGAGAGAGLTLGHQKFVGQVLKLSHPHGLEYPTIMDANVPQKDGYRFVYVLPFDETTVLVEDTRYADGPDMSVEAMRNEISTYAASKGWKISDIAAEEQGVLPIALAGDIDVFWNTQNEGVVGDVPRAGMRAGLFHPLTGYSLPDAAALALRIAETTDLSAGSLYALTRGYSVDMWRKRGFYRLLARMLFRAAAPEERYRVLARFYKLPQALIERFYASRSRGSDRLRILAGKPPVPILEALKVLREHSVANPQELKAAK
ncbi:lycopene beta-cyclase CrtY [Hyphococcus sp.]|uniref:lycopene beta-cyclase CrtY n=1 Tax=Hyphococcus sp. TaxID=2038636 RepID=UPI003CCBBBBC